MSPDTACQTHETVSTSSGSPLVNVCRVLEPAGAAALPSPTDRGTAAIDVRPIERHMAEHASFEAFQRERGGHHNRRHERGHQQCQHGRLLRLRCARADSRTAAETPAMVGVTADGRPWFTRAPLLSPRRKPSENDATDVPVT